MQAWCSISAALHHLTLPLPPGLAHVVLSLSELPDQPVAATLDREDAGWRPSGALFAR